MFHATGHLDDRVHRFRRANGGSSMDRQPLRISPTDAKALLDAGQGIVLDVVSPMVWDELEEAIPGAIRIPPEEVPTRMGELPKERTILAYCT
jgi:rhodanese-related sulfurtransferase